MSTKIRVYELARESGLDNREVVRRLADLGIEAKSHSSTVNEAEARQFRDSLGRRQAEIEEQERRRREREAAELARLSASAVAPPERKKAAKVLPPHLREQQEEREAASAASAEVHAPAPGPAVEEDAVEAAPPPAATTGTQEDGARGMPGAPPAPRMPGAPPRPVTEQRTPLAPPRRPGMPPTTGTGVPPRTRHVEPSLPQEGSGRRAIPPPLRPAPVRRPPEGPPRQPARPGAPSAPGGRGRTDWPYRQPVGRGAPGAPATPGAPTAPPPPPRGGPGGPPGRAAPGRGPAPGGRRRKKRKRKQSPEAIEEQLDLRVTRTDQPLRSAVDEIAVVSGITVEELAKELGVSGTRLVKMLFGMGEMATVQQSLPDDTVEIICSELGVECTFVTEEELEFGVEEPESPELLQPRPPIVTVMGHVDHGKTLLLDAIRETDVVSGEAGGITQHIGAYQVRHDGRVVTFIDTPGHEAFTAMRARGAQVTDVAILVVAADDGVMPQTVEAINHAKAAGVPIVVAVNKIDRPDAQPDRVRQQLTEHGIVAEEWGGETPMVNVSAKTKENLDELIEILLLQADLMELTANPERPARGRVIEAHLDKGRGPVATVLVQTGTLRIGDVVAGGQADGKVRAMFDENGQPLDEGGPSRPVQVLGWNDVPHAGDEFRVVQTEREARDIVESRQTRARRRELVEQHRPRTLEDLAAEVERGDVATLNLIIKGDVAGSVEALDDALGKLELPEVQVRVIHKGVGGVTENDVTLAQASDAIIVAFNVRPDANARDLIERTGVDLRAYRIIYEALDDIERAVKGMLAPEVQEVTLGHAEVRELFRVPRVGSVFGSFVTDGEVRRGARVRVVREGAVVAEDTVASLRRFKEDVREVTTGYECGIGLDRFQDVKVGDVFEVFEQREVQRV